MKIFMIALFVMMLSLPAFADQRFETNNGFCHFVLGIDNDGNSVKDGATVNDDNETFYANCTNEITTINQVAQGSTRITIKYPSGESMPLSRSIRMTGEETGVTCNMVDSNGTAYATNDWWSQYTVRGAKENRGNGKGKGKAKGKNAQIEYRLYCKNAPEQ